MASYKYHINKKGETGVCRAEHACPLGSSDDHFITRDEAQKAYEAKMTSQLMPEGKEKGNLGLKELNELVKLTSDPDIIREALDKGSDRTLRNLAKNENAGSHQLARAYNQTEDEATQDALTKHPNFPVTKMTPRQFANVLDGQIGWKERDDLLRSDAIGDAHIEAVLSQSHPNGRSGLSSIINVSLANPNNALSQEKIIELAEGHWSAMGSAAKSGRYPAGRIKNLDKKAVYWGNIDNTDDPAYLDGYADWSINRQGEDAYEANYYAQRVATNEATSSSTLEKLGRANLASVSVYKNPNTSVATKARLAKSDPEVGRTAKIETLESKFPDGLKKAITIEDETKQPYRNRGLYDTTVKFDTKKIKELGLDKEDIHTLMGRGKYNGGSSYDETTGVFRGTVDSTD